MRSNLGILLFSLGAVSAHGAALRVPQDYATINAALDAATSGDSVLVAPGTYSDYEIRVLQGGGPFTASSVAFLKGGVSLIGEGGRELTRIDLAGQGTGHAVPVLAYDAVPGTILVQGFTITGAPVGNAGIWNQYGDRMIIRGCVLEELDGGTRDAGGVYSLSADLEVYASEFRNCRAGAIVHGEGNAVLEGCLFAHCEGGGVGLDAVGVSPPFDAVVRDCEFRDNTGLAAALTQYLTLTVEGCTFVGNHASIGPSALLVDGGGGGVIEPGPYNVRGNLFALNTSTDGEAVEWARVSGTFEQNTLVGNGPYGLFVYLDEMQQPVTLRQNIFASTTGSAAVLFLGDFGIPPPVSTCNDFWNNPAGNTDGFPPGPTDLFLDPQFCNAAGGDYRLSGTSPCLPPNSGGCGQVGVYGQGCGSVSIEPKTWARTKAEYREDRQSPPASAR